MGSKLLVCLEFAWILLPLVCSLRFLWWTTIGSCCTGSITHVLSHCTCADSKKAFTPLTCPMRYRPFITAPGTSLEVVSYTTTLHSYTKPFAKMKGIRKVATKLHPAYRVAILSGHHLASPRLWVVTRLLTTAGVSINTERMDISMKNGYEWI